MSDTGAVRGGTSDGVSGGNAPEDAAPGGQQMTGDQIEWPAWLRDIRTTLAITPQYVLWGNVHDVHMVPGPNRAAVPVDTTTAAWQMLQPLGYQFLLRHDPVSGFRVVPDTPEAHSAAEQVTGADLSHAGAAVSLVELHRVVAAVTESREARAAVMLHRPTRMMPNVESLSAAEQEFFAAVERLAATAAPRRVGEDPRVLHNPVLWVLDREQDLPAWLIADNDAILRTVVVPAPDHEQRAAMARLLASGLPGAAGAEPRLVEEAVGDLVDGGEGMMLRELSDVVRLARDQEIPLDDIDAAIRAHRVGVSDNPWRKDYIREAVRAAEQDGLISDRVLGQPAAVTKALDILKRSVLGLSGAQARSSSRRPRGVLLFVGPTGTGKTELAKALTELIFGEGTKPLRFDMSEFRADQSEARLIGAPPGYVGFDAGGELTNGIRRKPFSLVLFDEIDKAHPRILDKFLQVLDEGRLTDGRGATVSFQETLLVFTSNAGMDQVNADVRARGGGIDDIPSYPELRQRLRTALEDYFIADLKRPELLNRFGDNIVVFDFIRPPVPRQIFDLMLGSVVQRVADEQGVVLTFDPEVLDQIAAECVDQPLMGGRGIGNLMESLLVDPLGRALFELSYSDGDELRVTGWSREDGIATLRIERR